MVTDLGGEGPGLRERSPRTSRSDGALVVEAPVDERFGKTAREFRRFL